MPDHWQSTTLGRVATVMTERVDPSVGPERRYLGLEHLASGNSRSVGSWGSTAEVTSSTTPFRAGDTLFGRLAAYLRKGCIAPFEGVCTPEILVLRTRGDVDSKFLGLLVLNDRVFDECIRLSAGTRMPRTSTKDLLKVAVLVPPVEEQQRIVDCVGAVDACIDALEAQITATRAARTAVLADLLGSPGHDWHSTTLGEIADLKQGSTIAVRSLPGGLHPVYGANGVVGWNSEGNITETTVALGCRGSCGTVTLAPAGAFLANNVMGLRAKPGHVDVHYLALMLEALDLRSSGAISGQVQEQITRKSLAPVRVVLPPVEEQRRIVEVVGAMDEQVAALESQAEATRQLRAGVLAELLSGERLLDESYDQMLGLS